MCPPKVFSCSLSALIFIASSNAFSDGIPAEGNNVLVNTRNASIAENFAHLQTAITADQANAAAQRIRASPRRPRQLTEVEAARFLTQATFGPTEDSINELVELGDYEAWIDRQMALPTSETLPYVVSTGNGSHPVPRHIVWWRNAMENEDQLRQRIAFALSEIFVVSDQDYTLANAQRGMTHYYDMLASHAFGNYRDLLEDVTLHPVMGIYLSMVRNQKANPELNIRPDENYAREVLQLFSVGLYKLNERGEPVPLDNPEPTYSQETVENFARVFTGWNFADSAGIWISNDLTTYDKTRYMVADYDTPPPDSYHDTGVKVLLDGAVLQTDPNSPTVMEDDMEFALDNISHHPNVGPFISKLLIQRLTSSNPSPEYVERVAARFNDNGFGERGDLATVIKAIFLDEEARGGQAVKADFGKVKEPLLRLTNFWRAFDAQPGPLSSNSEYRMYGAAANRVDEVLGQAVMRARSVFNFFLPDNSLNNNPGSPLVSPEMQILTEANNGSFNNQLHSLVYSFNNQNDCCYRGITQINIDKAVALANQPTGLLDYLELVLLAGDMPSVMRTSMEAHLLSLPNTEDGHYQRAVDAIYIIAASPAFMVQH